MPATVWDAKRRVEPEVLIFRELTPSKAKVVLRTMSAPLQPVQGDVPDSKLPLMMRFGDAASTAGASLGGTNPIDTSMPKRTSVLTPAKRGGRLRLMRWWLL
jgi:hypothetical protein